MGDVEVLATRGVTNAVPPSEVLNAAIVAHVGRAPSLTKARDTLDAVEWPAEKDYAKSAYEETLLANLHGRGEVFLDAKGTTRFAIVEWVTLPFAQAIASFLERRIISKAAFKRLSDAMRLRAFTIAGDHNSYTRQQVFDSLSDAIAEGIPQADWVGNAERLFDRLGVTGLGRHHLDTVFETNVFASYQHGRFRQQNTPALIKARPFLVYRTVGDERVRESHAAMDGFTAPRDHAIWKTWYPPNGFRCRCRVEAISKREAEETGIAEPGADRGVKPDEGFGASPEDFAREPEPRRRGR